MRRKRNCKKAWGHGGLEQWVGLGVRGLTGEGGHHPESHGKGFELRMGVTRAPFLTDDSARWLRDDCKGTRCGRGQNPQFSSCLCRNTGTESRGHT